MKSFSPVGNRVLVLPAVADEKVGMLYVPSQAQKKPSYGSVVAVGEGLRREDGSTMPMGVRVGDTVLYSPYTTGTEIEMDFVKYLLIDEKDVMGIVLE